MGAYHSGGYTECLIWPYAVTSKMGRTPIRLTITGIEESSTILSVYPEILCGDLLV